MLRNNTLLKFKVFAECQLTSEGLGSELGHMSVFDIEGDRYMLIYGKGRFDGVTRSGWYAYKNYKLISFDVNSDYVAKHLIEA